MKLIGYLTLALIALLFIGGHSFAQTRQVVGTDVTAPLQMRRAVDGDTTICVGRGGKLERCRHAGFDAPESHPGQYHCARERTLGLEAKGFLAELIRLETYKEEFRGYGKWYRPTVRGTVSGRTVAEIMISKGYGVAYDGSTRRTHWRDTLCPGVPLRRAQALSDR